MDKRRGRTDPPVRAPAGGRQRSRDGHPTVEELVAYHRDEAVGKARELLRDHLSLCEECARLLLDLEVFSDLEPPSAAHRLSDDDVEEAKEALRSRIRGETVAPSRPRRFRPPPKRG